MRLDEGIATGNVALIKTTKHLTDRYQLRGAAVLVAAIADHTAPYGVINPTSKPVTLYKGANVGTFILADQDTQVFSLDVEPSKEQMRDSDISFVPVDLSDTDMTESRKEQSQLSSNEYRHIFALSSRELCF